MENYYLKLIIQGLPKTPNLLMKKMAWKIKAGERRKWAREIMYLSAKKRPKTPLLKAKLTLIRHSSVAPDYDGLVGSFKFIIDALVTVGILIDDSMEIIGVPHFKWVSASPGDGSIEIIVESGWNPKPRKN